MWVRLCVLVCLLCFVGYCRKWLLLRSKKEASPTLSSSGTTRLTSQPSKKTLTMRAFSWARPGFRLTNQPPNRCFFIPWNILFVPWNVGVALSEIGDASPRGNLLRLLTLTNWVIFILLNFCDCQFFHNQDFFKILVVSTTPNPSPKM
jgi:hypothetical protein